MPNPAHPPSAEQQYFTIGEAAKLAKTKPHVIRYWEKKIPQLSAVSRKRNGRRYYSTDEVALLRRIGGLLADGGRTIDGVGAMLNNRPRTADNMGMLRRDIEKVMALL